jgi:HEAT repeat protein
MPRRTWPTTLALILIAPLARAQPFPQDTPEWRVRDAAIELLDPDSTELARVIACRRLRALPQPDNPKRWAIELAAKSDPSPIVRQEAVAAAAVLGYDLSGPPVAESAYASRARFFLEALCEKRTLDDRQRTAWRAFFDVPQGARAALENLPALAWQAGPGVIERWAADVTADLARLNDGTADERRAAIEHLAMFRDFDTAALPVRPALLRAIKDPSLDVRNAAATALGTARAAHDAGRARWIAQLADDDTGRRRHAVSILRAGKFDDDRTMAAVDAALAQSDWLTRVGLTDAVTRAWANDTTIAEALERQSGEAGRDVVALNVIAAARKILRAGKADNDLIAPERAVIIAELNRRVALNVGASLPWIRLLREMNVPPGDLLKPVAAAALSGDPEHRHAASEILMTLGDAALPAWQAMLQDERREVRGLALAQLRRLGPEAKGAAKFIAVRVSDPDPAIRRMAVDALAAIGPAAAPAVADEVTKAATRPTDAAVRRALARAAYVVDPDDDRFARVAHRAEPVPNAGQLIAQLRDNRRAVRLTAANNIAHNRLVPRTVAAALLKAIADGDFVTREGLTLGIERAWAERDEVIAVLHDLSDEELDPARRAYVNAALRAVSK